MRCLRDTRFRAGYQLRTMTNTLNTITTPANQYGCVTGICAGADTPKTVATVEVSITLRASTIVSQLSQQKLPERTSHSWVTAMMAAETLAIGWGANNPNGTMSCAK